MNVDKKIEIIKSFAEEFIGEDELRDLFGNQEKTKTKIIAYDGFKLRTFLKKKFLYFKKLLEVQTFSLNHRLLEVEK
jgi:hypothetical protein